MPSLIDLIGQTKGGEVQILQAKVIGAPGAGTATIRFGGTNTADDIAGVRFLSGVALADGDAVWVLRTGGVLLIIGRLASSGSTNAADTGVARIGTATYYHAYDFAGFAHKDRWAAGQYAVLQQNNGTTYINAYQNNIFFRRDNVDQMIIWGGFNGVVAEMLGLTGGHLGGSSRHKWWTDGEYQCTSIGIGGDNGYNDGLMIHNGWLRMKGEYGIYWEDKVGVGLFGHTDGSRKYVRNYGDCQTEYRGGGWAWTTAPMVIRSINADVGYNIHHDGLRNAALWLGWSDGYFRIEGQGYNAGVYMWDMIEYSTGREKADVRSLERDQTKAKVKALKAKRFKRKPPPSREQWEREVAEGIWKDEAWNDWVRSQDDEERVGLVAEEVAEIIPEAVPIGVDGVINGIRYNVITAYLVDMVQELDDRLAALEGKPT